MQLDVTHSLNHSICYEYRFIGLLHRPSGFGAAELVVKPGAGEPRHGVGVFDLVFDGDGHCLFSTELLGAMRRWCAAP